MFLEIGNKYVEMNIIDIVNNINYFLLVSFPELENLLFVPNIDNCL